VKVDFQLNPKDFAMPIELPPPLSGSLTTDGDIGKDNSRDSLRTLTPTPGAHSTADSVGTGRSSGNPSGVGAGNSTANVTGNVSGNVSGNGPSGGTGSGTDLLARVVQSAHQTIDRLADSAAPHVHKLEEGVSSASELVGERAVQARDTGEEWVESVRSTVRDNPLAAIATAVAVGLLIARITR